MAKKAVKNFNIGKKAKNNKWLLVGGMAAVVAVGLIVFRLVGASGCTIDDKLVNSCRPWLGAWSKFYGPTTLKTQTAEHEARIGLTEKERQLDIVHSYHGVGDNSLTSDERYFIQERANTILYTNWKPTDTWSQGGGSDAGVNNAIDQMAKSIKSVSPKKIMLTVYHEPEDNVSGGAPGCTTFKGKSGTPADYRAMWQNVRNRFDAEQVNNVVWVMNYQGGTTWDCMVKDMWPGNDLVDWVVWDPYFSGSATWESQLNRYYTLLEQKTDAAHAFTSKPWGLGEWGAWYDGADSQQKAITLYQDAKRLTESNRFPRIKMYTIFDAAPVGGKDSRTLYAGTTGSGAQDPAEQAAYNAFAQSDVFKDPVVEVPADGPATWYPNSFVTNGGTVDRKTNGTIYWKGQASATEVEAFPPESISVDVGTAAGTYCYSALASNKTGATVVLSSNPAQAAAVTKTVTGGSFNSCIDLPSSVVPRKVVVTLTNGQMSVYKIFRK